MFLHVPPKSDVLALDELHGIQAAAEQINRDLGTVTWKPVVVDVSHNRSLEGALTRECTVMLAAAASEGMGFAPLQLLASNEHAVAVVSQNTGAVEIAGSHFLIADASDVDDMSQKIGRALDMTPAEIRELRSGAEDSLRLRTVEEWAQGVLSIVDSTHGREYGAAIATITQSFCGPG